MADAAYTVRDEPGLVARIERDLAEVVATVRRGDPALRALVLTGGFARGEGAVLDGVPQNDYDLVAVRGLARPRVPYARMRADLERRLGLHVDLAPIAKWRLSWVARSIFWYETALRGRTLWGEDVLDRIPIRSPDQIDPAEGLRLLVNRAAGLLLVTSQTDAHALRLQAAKAFLAAADAHLLASGEFAPSQVERWQLMRSLTSRGAPIAAIDRAREWFDWAYRFKIEPDAAPPREPEEAWRNAARAVLDAVPAALAHARLPTLEAYARRDGILDHVVYFRRAGAVPGARRLVLHPTARVRVATLRLLEASVDGRIPPEEARRSFAPMTRATQDPVRQLEALRGATLQ